MKMIIIYKIASTKTTDAIGVEMTFSINAWLDRTNPFIELLNTKTGEIMAQFTGERLTRCLEQGDICLTELRKADSATQQELVRCLLLAHCANCLKGQLDDTFNECAYVREYRKRNAVRNNVLPFVAARKVSKA